MSDPLVRGPSNFGETILFLMAFVFLALLPDLILLALMARLRGLVDVVRGLRRRW